MKFQSAVYTAASGSIGGITYSRNRGGMYARGRAIPSNPATERQGLARENMSTAVAWWTNTLTPTMRTAWNSYAAATPVVDSLGASINLTGQQMFIRTQTVRLIADLTQMLVAPTMPGLSNTPQWTADPLVTADDQLISGELIADDGVNGDAAIVYMSRPVNASKTPAHEPRRFAGTANNAALTPDSWPFNDPADIPAPFMVATGQMVRVYALLARLDGRISAEASRDVLVLATTPP